MTITPLSSIVDMADGLPVLAVQGTVKVAMDVEHGIAKVSGKPWNKQFFVLAQNGAEVAATMWDAEGNEMKKGETVLIENTQNKKGQWSGMVKGSYTNKKKELCHTLEIKANQVKIKPINGDNLSGGDSTHVSAPSTVQPMAKGETPLAQSSDGINEARQHIMQSANLHVLCIKAVDKVIAPNCPEIAQTSEFFQASVASLFIEASRAGLVSKMPKAPVHNGNEKVERQADKQEENLMPYEETF